MEVSDNPDEHGDDDGLNGCVDPSDFPAWSFAEVRIGDELRVVSIFHVTTPAGVVPYWYEDPENQHRGLPLLKSMRPVLLGDYGSYLASESNMRFFVSLCKAIDDLPDPLMAVQVIRWMRCHNPPQDADPHDLTLKAMTECSDGVIRRRREFDQVLRIITGGPITARV